MEIRDLIEKTNIAEDLNEETLLKISNLVYDGYYTDLKSLDGWIDNLETWTKMALQVTDKKTYPWPEASNVKFPLLSTASLQFNARAYPTLVPSNGKIVNCKVVGSDPEGEKAKRAQRISTHMNYQLTEEMDNWEEDHDKLLSILPIAGTCFKKTYWDSNKQKNCSQLVLPNELIVNYWAKTIEDTERKTHVLQVSPRILKERQNTGLYLKTDLPTPSNQNVEENRINSGEQHLPEEDFTTPYILLEQHTYLDLDEDGYPEPYVVTIEKSSKTVLRVVARFVPENIKTDEKGDVVSIKAIEYFTKYGFMPNPDGGFYDIGFGRLLGPINASVDTLINQLIDAGSLSNLQAGFIGKGLRIKMGETRFKPGEWKAVNATGDDIKKQIFPLPVREPSSVLFNLLDLLVKSGKELASVAEIFVGKMPGQNTPATTTMASIQEGMRLFTAVYKRVYRSMSKEFKKIYLLNRIYMNPQEEISVLDEPIEQSDYQGSEDDIKPAADPSAASQQERLQKAQTLLGLIQLGTINPMGVTMEMVEALEIPNPEKFVMQPQPQPDPKMQELQMKQQMEQEKSALKQKELEFKVALEQQKQQFDQKMEEQRAQFEMMVESIKANMEMKKNQQSHMLEMQKAGDQHRMDMMVSSQQHSQAIQQSNEKHQQNLKQQKEKPKKKGE
jgi:chaperonin GroES